MIVIAATFSAFAVVVIVTIITPAIAAIDSAIMVAFAIPWNVNAVVPRVLNKVDPPVTGVVFATILFPLPCVAWSYAQVDRLVRHTLLHYPWLAILQSRARIVADVDLAIKSGLADADRHSDIGSICREACGQGKGCREKKAFHIDFLQMLIRRDCARSGATFRSGGNKRLIDGRRGNHP